MTHRDYQRGIRSKIRGSLSGFMRPKHEMSPQRQKKVVNAGENKWSQHSVTTLSHGQDR